MSLCTLHPAIPRLFPVVDDPGAIMEQTSIQSIADIPDQSTINITGVFDVPEEIIEGSIQDPDSVVSREKEKTGEW